MSKVLNLKKSDTTSGGVPTILSKSYSKVAKGTQDYIGRAIDCFLAGETGKFDRYYAVKNALVYRTISHVDGESEVRQDVVAVRLDSGFIIGNSSALGLIGRQVSFGRETLNRNVSEIQTRLSALVTMIPFTVFIEANLNLNKFEMVQRGPEETVTRKVPNPKYSEYDKKRSKLPKFLEETVHYTGASLFKVDGKTFLFDIDRREVQHKIFNPFLVEIVGDASSIEQAYDSLKPKEVKDAEAKGLTVLRQGEWFFIPVKGEFDAVKARFDRWDKKEFEPLVLRAGNNRPNNVSKYAVLKDKSHVVSGYVEHSGREHAKLMLNGWFKAVPNTSTRSFTIMGDVD